MCRSGLIWRQCHADLFADGFLFEKLLFELVDPVEDVVFDRLHSVHLLLDRRHRVERCHRHLDRVFLVKTFPQKNRTTKVEDRR